MELESESNCYRRTWKVECMVEREITEKNCCRPQRLEGSLESRHIETEFEGILQISAAWAGGTRCSNPII